MKVSNKKGFTLVELIIVITILAILATIAFVSFQSYTADARDAKRKSELKGIRDKIEVSMAANSQGVLGFVLEDTDGLTLTGVNFAWTTVSSSSEYKAWPINYVVIWADPNKYNFPYRIWAVSRKWNNKYQLITKLDDGVAYYTEWNYSPRTDSSINGSWTVSWTGSSYKILLEKWVWAFQIWDVIKRSGSSNTWEIIAISYSMSTLTISWATLTSWSWFNLASSESDYLVNTWAVKKE